MPTTEKPRKTSTRAKATEVPAAEALQRVASISAAAYFRAEERGFAPGGELADWLAAEQEFDAHRVAVR